MTDDEARQILELAQRAVNASKVLKFLPPDERLSPGWIPRLPE